MSIQHFSYCNSSIGKTVNIAVNNAIPGITGFAIGSVCGSPQPTIVGTVLTGEVGDMIRLPMAYLVPINIPPFARYVPIGSECLVAIDSVDIVNSATNVSNNGSIQINAVGLEFNTVYSIDGGATFQVDNIFTNLPPGEYNLIVSTGFGGPCKAYGTATVGFDDLVCDLGLGTITTEAAMGNVGKIKVVTITGYSAPVEYRLDAGAWQDSAEFTGLVAGVYNVQVRFKDYPTCTDSRDVTVFEEDTCDLEIVYVETIHEQSKFGDDGIIRIIVEGTGETIEYSIDDGDTYQLSNAFGNLEPGEYQIRVRNEIGCEDFRTVEIFKYKSPVVTFPIANSNRFVVTEGPMSRGTKPQNFDNTLFRNMRFDGIPGCNYWQKFKLTNTVVNQFRSNYLDNIAKLYDEDGALIATINPVKKSNNLGKTEVLDALFANGGADTTQVFFENGVPLFLEKGMDIIISGVPSLNGTFEIKDILPGTGAAEDNQVLIIEQTYTSPSDILTGTVTVDYDLEPYEVFEITTIWASYPPGKYYFIVEGTDPQFLPFKAESEPIELVALLTGHSEVVYKSFDNCKKVQYDTGIEHIVNVDAVLDRPRNSGERSLYTDSRDRLRKIESNVRRIVEGNVYETPFYILEKMAIAFDSDYFTWDGVEYQTEEDFDPKHFQNDALSNATIKLRQVDFEGDNSDDEGEQDVDLNILGDGDIVLGAP